MRSAGTIYKKLKEVKFHHLIHLYRQHLKKTPENCKYNTIYEFSGSDEKVYPIRLCLLHQDSATLDKVYPHLVDVCLCKKDTQSCNGFVCKYSRTDIKDLFERELEIKEIKEKKYPDICALEWVLMRSSVGVPPMSQFKSFLKTILGFFKKVK